MLYPRRLIALFTTLFLLGLVFAAEERQASPTTEIDILDGLSNKFPPEQSPPKEPQLSWRITNAERLRRGLPLKRPSFAKRVAAPAPSPVLRRAYIQVVGSDGSSRGYFSKASSTLVLVDPSIASALVVQYNAAASTPANLALQNGQGGFAPFPNLVAISPSSNRLMPGSSQYAWLGAGNETPLNSGPVFGTTSVPLPAWYESAIFVGASGDLAIQWVNPDGSKPSTYLLFGQGTIHLTGDPAAFRTTNGGNFQEVFLKLIEAP